MKKNKISNLEWSDPFEDFLPKKTKSVSNLNHSKLFNDSLPTKAKPVSDLKRSKLFDDWIPKKQVQEFFNYGPTKMSTFASDHNVRMAKVGRRIFFKYSDIVRLINESILLPNN